MVYARRGAASTLVDLSALCPSNLRSVYQRRPVASSCFAYLHPLRPKAPLLYCTVFVPRPQTVEMASCSEGSGSQHVESEDRLELSTGEGRDRTTNSGEVCPQPDGHGGVVQQEGGEEAEQGHQVSHELCRGGEGLLADDKFDGSHQELKGGHERGEGMELEDQQQMGEPSSEGGRGEGPERDRESVAEQMDVQQSGRGGLGAEGLIPHGKFTSEIFKIEVKNLPKVGFGVS